MNSVLISTLGEPASWGHVEYIYEGSSFSGKFTLPILLDNVDPKPNVVIIIVLDTTIDRIVSSYDELIEGVILKYNHFFKEVGLDESLIRLIIAPGVGRFQMGKNLYINFIGRLSDYYAYIMYTLSKILMKTDSSITIHLDITHGINFMPSLTLFAVKEIASMLALTRSVRLKVYNAEPYIKNVTTKLNIHLVDDSPAVIEYDLIPLGAEGKCVPLKRYNGDKISCEESLRTLTSRCERMRCELNAFLSSIFNGLPLALYTFYPDVVQLENTIEEFVEIWRRNISVTSSENEMYIRRSLSFSRDFTKLIQIWFIARMLNLQRKTEVSYEELDSLREVVFSKLSKKIYVMINRDLPPTKNDIEKKKELCRDWTRLRTIYGKSKKEFDERDFLAHSGLEMTVTEVKCDGQLIMLRYAKSELKRVINGCIHGLQKPT